MGVEIAEVRRTTVMNLDIVGYAAMMAEDPARTVIALLLCFRQIEGVIERFGGRVVDAPGDNMLAEFRDEDAALRCAIEVQTRFSAYTPSVGGPVIRLRMGLHSGEALERRGRLYGDPVNIAARLQAAAEPGAILLSESVAERASQHAYRALEELGRRWYKNVPYAVATYCARP